ncbi:MAG: hypothetical protein VX527_08780 [Planctomycetota bacterium]|nr:hypothetical protein [Planctomycetota bacterium]
MSDERIVQLEQRLRRTQLCVVALLIGASLLISLGMMAADDPGAQATSAVQPQLKVGKLVIVDEKGQAMIILQPSGEEEGPSIQVNDEQGTKRFWMGTKEEGGSRLEHWDVETSDRDSVLRILSFIDDEGLAVTQYDDDLGRRRIGMGTSTDEGSDQMGFITCADKEERSRIWMGTSDDGMSEVIHTDANGVRRIFDFTDGDSSRDPSDDEKASDFLAGRWYGNPYETSRMWLGSDRSSIYLSQYDWGGKIRMAFSTMFSGAARMALWNDEGDTVWSQQSQGEPGQQP